MALWMSRRNGRAIARRLKSEEKSQMEMQRIARQELQALGKGLAPPLQQQLLAEGMSAAAEWWRKNGSPGR